VGAALFGGSNAAEAAAALSLARKLAPAGRDLKKLAAAMDANWREIYGLAELIADRHVRDGECASFLEPVVDRFRPAVTTYDHDWKEKLTHSRL
jgi:hypothetical protein